MPSLLKHLLDLGKEAKAVVAGVEYACKNSNVVSDSVFQTDQMPRDNTLSDKL